MRTFNILTAMGIEDLRNLGRLLGLRLPTKKQTAVQALSEYLQSAEGFSTAYSTLTERERQWLDLFMSCMQTDGYMHFFSRRMLNTMYSDQPELREEAEAALTKLQRLGFMARTHIWYSSEGMEFADDLRVPLYEELYKRYFHPVVVNDADVHSVTRMWRTFSRDMTRFLATMAVRPVGFTKNNVLYKREVPKVLPCFHSIQHMMLSGTGIWEGIPGAIVMAVRSMVAKKMIRIDEGTLMLQWQEIESWLWQDDDDLYDDMYDLVTGMLKENNHYLNELFIMWLNRANPGEWVPMQAAFSRLFELFQKNEETAWETVFNYFLIIASMTGLIEYGVTSEHGTVVRLAEWPDAQLRGMFVQPNLELLVPEEAPLALHFLAGQLGAIKQADVMTSYRLNKERILQLCDRGWKYEDLKLALEVVSETPVAASVLKTINDWMKTYNRAVLWDAMIVRFQSPEWFHAFMNDRRTKAIMIEPIADAAVLIKRNGEKTAREVLFDIGAPAPQEVRRPMSGGGAVTQSGNRLSKANADALNRVTGTGMVEALRMKMPSNANLN